MFTTPSGHPHPQSSLFHAQRNGGSATQQRMGRDNHVPPQQGHPPPIGHAEPPHTLFKPTPEREHQPSKRGRSGGTTLPHHPKQARQHQSTQTPKGEHAPRVNTKPSHQRANTPTTSLLFHHPREHKKRPHSNVWAQPSVSATGEPWKSRRPARTKRKRPTRARRTTHTTSAQTTRFAYGVPPAPAREDSAREGRSQ